MLKLNNRDFEDLLNKAVRIDTVEKLLELIPLSEFDTYSLTHKTFNGIDPLTFQPTVVFTENNIMYSVEMNVLLDAKDIK